MNLYETVKGRVTPQMAAERYDLPVNRSGMACCPFHNDRTPSMKLYPDHFHCFGCGQTGDVIDLTAQLTGQNARDAAGRLATDFGIPMQTGEDTAPRPAKEIPYHLTQQFRESERLCFSVLTDYLHLLRGWKVRYAPKTPDEPLGDRFVEACQMECHMLKPFSLPTRWAMRLSGRKESKKINHFDNRTAAERNEHELSEQQPHHHRH